MTAQVIHVPMSKFAKRQMVPMKVLLLKPAMFLAQKKMVICSNCPGNLKNKPFIGLPFIWGFKQDAKNPREFNQGHVLDPIGGKVYKGKARLSANGKRLTLRGYVGVSVIGRSVTWVKY